LAATTLDAATLAESALAAALFAPAEAGMKGLRLRWLLFGLAAGLLVFGLALVSLRVLALETQSNQSRVFWVRQRLLQLALWRMDAALSPLVATESARPTYHYTAFYREREPFAANLEPLASGGVLLPSPLLRATRPANESLVTLHFQIGPDRRWTSPQVPDGAERQLALRRGFLAPEELRVAFEHLAALERHYDYEQLLRADPSTADAGLTPPQPAPPAAPSGADPTGSSSAPDDFLVRNQNLQRTLTQVAVSSYANAGVEPPAVTTSPLSAVFLPARTEGEVELLFLRHVDVGGARFVQGVWSEWSPMRQWLMSQVRDLLGDRLYEGSAAELVPTPPGGTRELIGDAKDALAGPLASLPCTLVIRNLHEPTLAGLSGTQVALIVAWVVVLAAIAAFAFVLRTALELSERRGQFVSAVTHELRTPLTTFCLYSEMLADGIVREPTAQHEYLVTLKQESARLRRIVESVLAYARLEDGRSRDRAAPIAVTALLDACLPTLQRRAREGGFELVVHDTLPAGAEVEVDAQSFEQVLFNLVDNACKYAQAASERRLELHVGSSGKGPGRELVVRFADHGPGIPAGREREIFQAFRRAIGPDGAQIPGLGLGLSLARGLARQMGGDLVLEAGPGARFRFVLPLATA
jgi:signal transduction histidine kinase